MVGITSSAHIPQFTQRCTVPAAATMVANRHPKLSAPLPTLSSYAASQCRYQLPARSLSAKTSFAANNPLSAEGKPAYTAICIMISTTSCSVQPTFNAPWNMHLQLRRSIAQCCQCRNHGDFPGFQIKARSRIDIAKREFNQQPGKFRGNVLEAFNYPLPCFSINFLELFPTPLKAFIVVHLFILSCHIFIRKPEHNRQLAA